MGHQTNAPNGISRYSDAALDRVDDICRLALARPAPVCKSIRFLPFLFSNKRAYEIAITRSSKPKAEYSSNASRVITDYIDAVDIPHEVYPVHREDRTIGLQYECFLDREGPPPQLTRYRSDTQEQSATYHRQLGRHYGYPESAIEGFLTGNSFSGYQHDESARQTLLRLTEESDSVTPCDLGVLSLTSFAPAATVTGIEDAVSLGKQYERDIRRIAEWADLTNVVALLNEETRQPKWLSD